MSPTEDAVVQHGTTASYRRGCRCDDCRAANTECHRELRAKRKARKTPEAIEHGKGAYVNWGCRCEVCTKANSEACFDASQRYQRAHRKERSSKQGRRWARVQAQTLEKAVRHGYQWTGPELELIARRDLTAKQAAAMLGRTLASVQGMRALIKREPRYINLAGVGRVAADPAPPHI